MDDFNRKSDDIMVQRMEKPCVRLVQSDTVQNGFCTVQAGSDMVQTGSHTHTRSHTLGINCMTKGY